MTRFAISQPMKGKTREEIEQARAKVRAKYEARGWEFVETCLGLDNVPADVTNKPLWCLARSLGLMAGCDVVVFLDGWENSRGCVIEHGVCQNYNRKTIQDRD